MRQEQLRFAKKNGMKIAATAFIPEGEGKHPVIIFTHGFGGNCKELMEHGPAVADAGMVGIFFDFCGGGIGIDSDGIMAEMTVQTEIEDLEVVMDEVVKLPYVDPDRVFFLGESMGGMVAALVAAKRPTLLKGLVMWYPAFVVPDDARKRCESGVHSVFGVELNPKFDEGAMAIDVYGTIGGYKGPVKILHGNRDTMVPLSYSERAVEVYEQAELEVFRGAEHVFEDRDSERALESSIAFMKSKM